MQITSYKILEKSLFEYDTGHNNLKYYYTSRWLFEMGIARFSTYPSMDK